MRTRTAVVLGAAAILGALSRAEAQRAALTIALGGQYAGMDSIVAADRGMGTSGPGFVLGMDIEFKRYFVTSVDIGALFFKDNRPFSQSVICIPNCGGGSEKSTINTTLFGVSVGLQTPRYRMGRMRIGPSVRLGAMSVSGNRAVNCSGCTKQDLALDGGGFIEFRVTSRIGRSDDGGMTIGVARRQFLSNSSPFSPSTLVQFGAMLGQ